MLILLSSLLVLYSVLRIFIHAFWGEEKKHQNQIIEQLKDFFIRRLFSLTVSALRFGHRMGVPYVDQAAETSLNPEKYIEAVLKE
ncbi:hypothetical protein KQR57_17125 [Bacillus inaquosorum]|nr:hypothetical protein [Bacillus inaquosorum]